MIPPIFGTCLAIYSEMPTSDSLRRIIAPFSSCKGGAVPRREWLGGRIVATLAESEDAIDKVTDCSGAKSGSSVLSSSFNRFGGGSSVVLSKDCRLEELGKVGCILTSTHRAAVPETFFTSKLGGE